MVAVGKETIATGIGDGVGVGSVFELSRGGLGVGAGAGVGVGVAVGSGSGSVLVLVLGVGGVPATHVGNLNDPMRVTQFVPCTGKYMFVYQNVQSSAGSTLIAL